MIYRISRLVCLGVLKSFFRFKVIGRENVPRQGSFILAANHASYLDPPAVGSACPRKVYFMARHDLFTVPVLGNWMRAVGVFPVRRRSADISALKDAIKFLKQGKGLALFPQGERSGIDNLDQDIQPGIAFIAQKSGAPVVPVIVKGTDVALPKGAKRARFVKVTVCFGKPIQIGKGLAYQDAAAQIASEIKKLSQFQNP